MSGRRGRTRTCDPLLRRQLRLRSINSLFSSTLLSCRYGLRVESFGIEMQKEALVSYEIIYRLGTRGSVGESFSTGPSATKGREWRKFLS